MRREDFILDSPQETFDLGEKIGDSLKGGEIILLFGGLGVGKTLLTKGILNALDFDIDEVTSPSFTLVNHYKAKFDVYHIDLWRIDESSDAAAAVGLDEILENEKAVVIVEWADRLHRDDIASRSIQLRIEGDGDELRKVTVTEPQTEMGKALRIEIGKSDRKLFLFDGDQLVKAFDVAFGSAPYGAKEARGDGRTPEGAYFVCVKNPQSKYHLSLGLSYPNERDAESGLAAGSITQDEHDAIIEAIQHGKMPPQDTPLGGEIYIHGGGTDGNWTHGCIGLADEEMTELFEVVAVGTRVEIKP